MSEPVTSGPRHEESRSRMGGLLRALLVGGGEVLLALGLVLTLSLVIMGVLTLSFPEGTGLIDFYGELVRGARDGTHLQLLYGDEGDAQLAVLTHVERRVRDRAADAIAWKDANPGMPLGNRHTVQTLARSHAEIIIEGRSRLRLAENSLVVIRGSDRARGSRRKSTSLVLLGGDVRGRLEPSAGARALDIVTAGGASQIHSDEGSPAEFSVAINPDQSTTYSIFAGRAEVTSAGETAVVLPDHAVTVFPDRPPGKPRRIPDPPRLFSPADGSRLIYGPVAPEVEFAWADTPRASEYRFTIARDPEFSDVVFDGGLRQRKFVHGNLGPGRYYWRVNAVAEDTDGRFSETRSLRMVQDLEPPQLHVPLPEDPVHSNRLVLEGTTEPGAELFVGDARVAVGDNGRFEYTLELSQGLNYVVVESVDAAGNSAYRSKYVSASY